MNIEALTTDDLKRGAAAISPADFAHFASHGRWQFARHLDYLNGLLMGIMAGTLTNLMIFMPPRHGKSELASKYFPCVFLGNNPHKRVIECSYSSDLAANWGWHARNLMDEFGPELWGVSVSPDSSARDRWDLLNLPGGMITTSVGGPITGRGADLMIVDDPVKNDEEANSKTYRDKIWDWWQSTAQTRREPGGACVVILTRWHQDDLAGRLLTKGEEEWTVCSLPALAEEGDALGREPGEALWPERWPVETLEKRRRAAGSYYWAALYQQRPAPSEGAVFRRGYFRYYTNSGGTYKLESASVVDGAPSVVKVDDCWKFVTVDLAASTRTSADYTVISTWGVTSKMQLLLIDRVRDRLAGPDQIPKLREVYERHRPSFIQVEKAGYQLSLIQGARREGLPIVDGEVDKDKLSRAIPAAAKMECGEVFFPKEVPWIGEWEEELISFPHGEHDDQVDTLSAAVAELARRGTVHFG